MSSGMRNCMLHFLHEVPLRITKKDIVIRHAARPQKIIVIILTALLVAAIIVFSVDDVWVAHDRIGTARYVKERILKALHLAYDDVPIWDGKVGDKVIVMAHTYAEDVSWVEKELPE